MLTLGSLFDGAGGFPLAALSARLPDGQVDISPIWASEVEPFPILVTSKNIPQMQHLGDITKINGAKIPPVDIITGGSPCQDLSSAGQRAGLNNGNRSVLFFEMIRIIKEMREATNEKYPTYAVWENVPGAFSSNRGEDFRIILEEFCRIKEPTTTIPRPKKWNRAGQILGGDFSIGWRILNAKYFGVPQSRRRIFLVADFRGESAPKILFKPTGVPWHFEPSQTPREETSASSTKCTNSTIGKIKNPILPAHPPVCHTGRQHVHVLENHATAARMKIREDGIVPTLTYAMGTGGNKQPLIQTIFPLKVGTLGYSDYKGLSLQDTNKMLVQNNQTVRRLTPLECARLQGFPDNWTENLATPNPTAEEITKWQIVFSAVGKIKTESQVRTWLKNPYSDSAAYKMWGNSVAVLCVEYILQNIRKESEK